VLQGLGKTVELLSLIMCHRCGLGDVGRVQLRRSCKAHTCMWHLSCMMRAMVAWFAVGGCFGFGVVSKNVLHWLPRQAGRQVVQQSE
jgi:hypothetical protein